MKKFKRYRHLPDKIDWFVLTKIRDYGNLGTIKLAEKIGIAPKNLILRIDTYLDIGWIKESTIPVKPKGRKKVYQLTTEGMMQIRYIEDYDKMREENLKLSPIADKEFKEFKQKIKV